MVLLGINDVSVSFGERTLFSGASFDVSDGEKIGFIGVNGSGKTTMFNLLKGNVLPDSGSVHITGGVRVGFMEQFACADPDRTLRDEALTVFDSLMELELDIADIHDRIDCGDCSEETLSRFTALTERYEQSGGLTYKSRTAAALAGLGFTESDLTLRTGVLSGGQKSKLQLAKLMLSNADILLLDEPTNHLDIQSVEWLEDFLINYGGAFIVISHDRYFLDKVTKRTLEIENGRFRSYNGSYSEYIAQREIEKLTQQRNYDSTVKEIQRLELVVEQQRRWKHKKNKKTHTLDNTRKAIERLENSLVAPDKTPDSMNFRFRATEEGTQYVLTAEKLGMGFGGKKLFENADLLIKKGEKVFLIGPNGCGKTTLFRILTGQYKADFGTFKEGARVQTGYFDQEQRGLDEKNTALDEVWNAYPNMTETAVRSALASFLFKGDDVYKLISELSGGERARIALLKLMLSEANLLLLDEPTNHLDIASCEALENALMSYEGTLFVISHDRYLINKLADRLYKLTPKGTESYLGNYDYYLEKQQSAEELSEAPAKPQKSEQALDYQQRRERASEQRKLRTRIERAEKRVEELDALMAEKTAELSELSDYKKAMELSEEIERLRLEQEKAMEEWDEASSLLDTE